MMVILTPSLVENFYQNIFFICIPSLIGTSPCYVLRVISSRCQCLLTQHQFLYFKQLQEHSLQKVRTEGGRLLTSV